MKLITHLAIVLVLTSLSSYVSAQDVRATMTQEQLLSLQQAAKAPAYTLLDVRSAEEYSEGHIAGAVNIAHGQLTDKLGLLSQDKDRLIIVYCRSGRRAGIAENILKDNGYTNVKHLDGDMKGWLSNERPVTR